MIVRGAGVIDLKIVYQPEIFEKYTQLLIILPHNAFAIYRDILANPAKNSKKTVLRR